ncbi:hypothetical protein FH972_022401 [Carpinus fangiana]|uniref:Acid phosphatase n=1 Tax=Carpinus fangiana TaxID=176857 RepID=A0A5N6KUD8_9ROSI|nr:hypothetical protein FH972_022401 [Carpinus fangiana]
MVRLSTALAAALPASAAAETVLGAYIFSRHGDRTAKKTPPTGLTNLGYQQVHDSGNYYSSRYVAADSQYHILGLNSSTVKLSQLAVSAPADGVLQNSASAFLQGLYPPVGANASAQTLANGTSVDAPLDGFQLIPIAAISSNAGSEDTTWLQDATGCANAETSSNQYFYSAEYEALLASTMDFYQRLYPVVNQTFSMKDMSFKNAYSIYDLINVAEIHNATIQSNDLVTASEDTFHQLLTLANSHEFGLAYNQSSPIRGVAGMQLAAEIVDFLNGTIAGAGKQKLGIQFGAYGTFLSFFGLSQLAGHADGDNFYGIADYAATMTFELYTDADVSTYPTTADDVRVRFMYNNGTTTVAQAPTVYPLFGQQSLNLSWADFAGNMSAFSIGSTEHWCSACGNSTGVCAPFSATAAASSSSSGNGNGLSPAVNGVIGAMVTLAVILLIEGLIVLVGGLRIVRKKDLRSSPGSSLSGPAKA